MTRREDTHRRLQAEIAGEKAAALGRAGERLEAALQEVAVWAERLRTAERAERAALAESYDGARARALQARLTLLIQREAIGLRRHAVVDQQFPEPPPSSRVRELRP